MNIIKFILIALIIVIVAGFTYFALIDPPIDQITVRETIPAESIFHE